MALDTVTDYATEARRLLQDQVAPYRYPDADLVMALNIAITVARAKRADLFLGDGTTTLFQSLPVFTAVNTDAVPIEHHYRMPFVMFVVGYLQLRDQEDTNDSRAAALLNKFSAMLSKAQS